MIMFFQFTVLILAFLHASDASVTQNLTPFLLELRSENRSSFGNFESDLIESTTDHLTDYFSRELIDFEHLSLTIEAYTSEVTILEGSGLRRRDRSRGRSLDSTTYTSSVTYGGTVTLKDSHIGLHELQDLQINSFIGQSKLDYLTVVQSSSDAFLSAVNNVILTFKGVQLKPLSSHQGTSLTLIIAIVSAVVGILIIGSAIGIFYYLRKRRAIQKVKTPIRKKRKVKINGIPDLGLASLGSVSLHTDPVHSSDSSESSLHLSPSSETIGSHSMVSTDTIDMNGSIDMIAWKNQVSTGNKAPFDTDLTMICKNSPNKTLRVENKLNPISSKRLTDKKSQKVREKITRENYLSKESLQELSKKNRFTEHSARYHNRVHGKKNSSRKYRSVKSRPIERNEENSTGVSHSIPLVRNKNEF